jgi:hypothetical protein
MVELNFEMLEPDAKTEFQPLPEGWYSASVFQTERTTSAAGNDYLNVTFEVTSADHAGRRQWDNFNLWHPGENVRGISERRFSDLARAVGFSNTPKDSDELLDLHLDIYLKIDSGNSDYGPKNKVVAYRAAPSAIPPLAKAANGDSSLDDPPWPV